MDKNYQVDDILAEIKRKKAGRSSQPAASPSVPEIKREERITQQADTGFLGSSDFGGWSSIELEREKKSPAPAVQESPRFEVRLGDIDKQTPPAQREQEPVVKPHQPRRQSNMAEKWKAFSGQDGEENEAGGFFDRNRKTAEDEVSGLSWQQEETAPAESAVNLRYPSSERSSEDIRMSTRIMDKVNSHSGELHPSYSTEDAPYELEKEELLEYESVKDAQDVYDELEGTSKWLKIRMAISAVTLILLIYLDYAYSNINLPLPTFMFPENNAAIFFAVSLGILVICALFNANTIGGGLISLFTFKGNNDTYAALGILACIVQGAAMVVAPDQYKNPAVHLYLPIGALIMVFNNMGKMSIVQRIARNFGFITKAPNQAAVLQIGSKELSRDLTRNLGLDSPVAAYSAKVGFLSNFLQLSYSEDFSQQVAKILTPVCFISSILTAVVAYFFNGDIFIALTVFTAALCITSPLSAVIAAGRPLLIAATRLAKHKCMISGYAAAERLAETNAVLLSSSQLFPQGAISLSGIKVFEQNRIDEAILDAASVVCSCESTLTDIFHDVIEGKISLLKKIDSLSYEDGMGLSAWVEGKRVLIGSRELMAAHGIDIPSRDFEDRYLTSSNMGIIYLANSGQLTAMYVISYTASKESKRMLASLEENDICLIYRGTDPNLTPKKLEEIFDYPADMITVVPAKLHDQLDRMTVKRNNAKAFAAFVDSRNGLVNCITAAKACHSAVNLGVVLQLIGIVLGFGLVCFLSFMQSTSQLSWIMLCLYQLLWTAAVAIIPNIRKN